MSSSYFDKMKEEIRIIDYARKIGFTPKKVGSRYYTLKEHDSVRIDPVKNLFFQNSSGVGGSCIDFAMHFTGRSLQQVLKEFTAIAEKQEVQLTGKTTLEGQITIEENVQEKISFKLPEADKDMKNVFAYLTKTRRIDAEVVKELIHGRQLYQDKKKNCVFVSYKEGEPVFACKRGTNTYVRFVGDVIGSDYSYLFFIDNDADQLIITESPIDAVSKICLLDLADRAGYNYLALCGCQKYEEAIAFHLSHREYRKITLCLDNDAAGKLAAEKIREYMRKLSFCGEITIEFPLVGKDVNDELKIMKEEQI